VRLGDTHFGIKVMNKHYILFPFSRLWKFTHHLHNVYLYQVQIFFDKFEAKTIDSGLLLSLQSHIIILTSSSFNFTRILSLSAYKMDENFIPSNTILFFFFLCKFVLKIFCLPFIHLLVPLPFLIHKYYFQPIDHPLLVD